MIERTSAHTQFAFPGEVGRRGFLFCTADTVELADTCVTFHPPGLPQKAKHVSPARAHSKAERRVPTLAPPPSSESQSWFRTEQVSRSSVKGTALKVGWQTQVWDFDLLILLQRLYYKPQQSRIIYAILQTLLRPTRFYNLYLELRACVLGRFKFGRSSCA